jgi:BirA family biotin operon repressor/biotin-[acetyl-CoA-carboxylase] ligase
VSRGAFIRCLLENLEKLYHLYLTEGYAPIREAWLSSCNLLGRRVRVTFHDRDTEGLATGIDEDGALLVHRDDGKVERVLAGDVTILGTRDQ